MRIACLHTAESNVAVFEAAAREIGLPQGALRHEVRVDLLAEAQEAGGLTPAIAHDTAAVLLRLCRSADAVLLACTTLAPSTSTIEKDAPVPVLRLDRALAEHAVQAGGKIVVLCTVPTTMAPTTQLFDEAASQTGAEVEVRLIPDVWALFMAGDRKAYFAGIADAADAAYREGASMVAFAQASMVDAAGLVTRGPKPLCSPAAALAAIVERLSGAT